MTTFSIVANFRTLDLLAHPSVQHGIFKNRFSTFTQGLI